MDWEATIASASKLYVAGPWEEARPRMWTRSVIWRPRLNAPCPCIDLDGYVALVGHAGERWSGSGSLYDTPEEAKAEEDRRLREQGWILADVIPVNHPRSRD